MPEVGYSSRSWILRSFGRNPLVRLSDRFEAAAVVLALLIGLLALPFAAAVGTAVHEERAHVYARRAQALHSVEAVATRDSVTELRGYTIQVSVPVAWAARGESHTDVVRLPGPVHAGDAVTIWLDDSGRRVDAPPEKARAGAEAIASALALWVGVAAACAVVVGLLHLRLSRSRARAWDRELQHLVGDDGGRTARG